MQTRDKISGPQMIKISGLTDLHSAHRIFRSYSKGAGVFHLLIAKAASWKGLDEFGLVKKP